MGEPAQEARLKRLDPAALKREMERINRIKARYMKLEDAAAAPLGQVLMNLSFGQRGFRANFAPSRVTR
jgi:hypothetical protein